VLQLEVQGLNKPGFALRACHFWLGTAHPVYESACNGQEGYSIEVISPEIPVVSRTINKAAAVTAMSLRRAKQLCNLYDTNAAALGLPKRQLHLQVHLLT
jgi:hypothetical protein